MDKMYSFPSNDLLFRAVKVKHIRLIIFKMLIQFDIVSISFCVISKKNDGNIQSWLKVTGATSVWSHIIHIYTSYLLWNLKNADICHYLKSCSKPVWYGFICITQKVFFFHSGHFFNVMKVNEVNKCDYGVLMMSLLTNN